MSGKLIIFSAPSGAGKSTIVQYLLTRNLNLEFSISATSRALRGAEVHAKDYYFLSAEDFRKKIENNEFVEFEEVYTDIFYGTLKSEIERITSAGNHVIFDVDVVGGLNLKKIFGDNALAMFIAPPGIEELRKRLISRATDSPEMISQRVSKAEYEMSFAPKFDVIVVNDDLEKAKTEAETLISNFIEKH